LYAYKACAKREEKEVKARANVDAKTAQESA
jgi:hypothetical protein